MKLVSIDVKDIQNLIDAAAKENKTLIELNIRNIKSTFVEVKQALEARGYKVQRLGSSYSYTVYWSNPKSGTRAYNTKAMAKRKKQIKAEDAIYKVTAQVYDNGDIIGYKIINTNSNNSMLTDVTSLVTSYKKGIKIINIDPEIDNEINSVRLQLSQLPIIDILGKK